MSSGTPERREILRFPDDPDARAILQEWADGGPEAILLADGVDFRGLDLSGSQVFEMWAMSCDVRGVRLVGTDFAGARLYRSDLREADLTSAVLPDADATEVRLDGACLRGANLRSVEAPDSRWRACDLSRAEIGGGLRRTDLQAADLRGTVLIHLDLRGANLAAARLESASGSVFGPFVADVDGEERLVGGPEAEAWFAARGAEVEVLSIDEGVR